MNKPLSILKEYWGYDAFRPMQEDIINAVLNKQDTLALLPTGGGKSLCFQVPTLVLNGMCLVISPLIALMKDQVMQLNRRNISAQSINASMNFYETKEVLEDARDGKYKFLYVSPERLNSNTFLDYLPDMNIELIAVDEAHCISQWGYDFRPAYLRIKKIREYLKDVPVIALTASATPTVQEDILNQLNMKNAMCFRQSFERPNLAYSIVEPASKHTHLLEIIKDTNGSGIIYCKSRRQTKVVSDLLISNGISADFYHAGLTTEMRTRKQDAWISGSTQFIASTNAFGMGIDKPDVRIVVHFDIPDCLENYYQEAGRAGRDLKYSTAVLLQAPGDVLALRKQIDIRFPDFAKIKSIYLALMNHLQIAAGLGEGTLRSLDIGYFAEHFKLSVLDVTYVLQALEKDGTLSFNESTWQPSTIQFNYTTTDIRSLDTGIPFLNDLFKSLLRMYEGILDHEVKISEMAIARFMSKELSDIQSGLNELSRRGIIHYKPKMEEPSVYLMLNRMYADDFRFNMQSHLERKKIFGDRIESMIDFITQTSRCRSIVIGNYFGDLTIKECNICDICKSKKAKKSSISDIAAEVLQMLHKGPVKLQQLESRYGVNTLKEVIQLLDAESKINLNTQGELECL